MNCQDPDANRDKINFEALEILANLVERVIKPYIVAIYAPRLNYPNDISQVGTGFLVQNDREVSLVTARHVYYGQTGSELPGEKLFFVNGALNSVGDLIHNEIYGATGLDLACVRLPEMPLEKGMPFEWLLPSAEPTHISIIGYLARDFKRDRKTRTLRPAPRLYSNRCRMVTDASIVMDYPKSRNRITSSRKRGMTPIPRGVSGAPMIRSEKILSGTIEVVGVFTDYVDGTGIGVPTALVRDLLLRIREDASLDATFKL